MKPSFILALVTLTGCLRQEVAPQPEAATQPTPCIAPDAGADSNASATNLVAAYGADASWELRFSPAGGCTEAIVRLIASARSSVQLQAYTFTSHPITTALLAAQGRGVSVTVVLDRSAATTAATSVLVTGGVTVYVDSKHAIAHNKVIIVDGAHVETGSFNYSYNAEYRNAENCLILHDRAMARAYSENFAFHQEHSSKL